MNNSISFDDKTAHQQKKNRKNFAMRLYPNWVNSWCFGSIPNPDFWINFLPNRANKIKKFII
jgi:hypothetical protein